MRRGSLLFLVGLMIALLGGFKHLPNLRDLDLSHLPNGPLSAPAIDNWSGAEPPRSEVLATLNKVAVIDARPSVPGYDRNCGPGDSCVFGPAWSDDTAAAGGHDGCDTRDNVLARQLRDVSFRPGTHDCVVITGRLDDPYTGRQITFAKDRASLVQIDHVFPLARAWDMGAATWSLQQRMKFANDVALNLLAVDGSANASKGDRGPGEWMPINRGYACTYAARYLKVATSYRLAITTADATSLRAAAQTCPRVDGKR